MRTHPTDAISRQADRAVRKIADSEFSGVGSLGVQACNGKTGLGFRLGAPAVPRTRPAVVARDWTGSCTYRKAVATANELLTALARYREARLELLRALELPVSNRDPLSEFAERLVAALTGGTFPPNRNQPGWDVRLPDGATVQVKYVANSGATGAVNWHPVRRIDGAEWYALVIFQDFVVDGVVMFPSAVLVRTG
jgi:hypothetical protein